MAEAPNVTDIWCRGRKEKKKGWNKLRAGFSNLTLPLLPTESSPSAIKRGLGKCPCVYGVPSGASKLWNELKVSV